MSYLVTGGTGFIGRHLSNGRMLSIRRPRRPGTLRVLMPASGGPARLVTYLPRGSSLRHPI
jgi:nucleoside-diphosphate-sugar epimerase